MTVDICPRCQKKLAPDASFCPRCGLSRAAMPSSPPPPPPIAPPPRHSSLAMFGWFLLALIALFVLMGAVLFFFAHSVSFVNQPAAADNRAAEVSATPPAPPALDVPQTAFYGAQYMVGPTVWTPINVVPPPSDNGHRYRVALEGIDRFVARPDGDPRREYAYPDPQGLTPAQLSGRCRVLWVRAADGTTHWVRVKYERVGGLQG